MDDVQVDLVNIALGLGNTEMGLGSLPGGIRTAGTLDEFGCHNAGTGLNGAGTYSRPGWRQWERWHVGVRDGRR